MLSDLTAVGSGGFLVVLYANRFGRWKILSTSTHDERLATQLEANHLLGISLSYSHDQALRQKRSQRRSHRKSSRDEVGWEGRKDRDRHTRRYVLELISLLFLKVLLSLCLAGISS